MLGSADRERGTGIIDAKPTKVDPLEVNEAEDGLVIYDPGRDLVHHLNPTASMIFDLCDGTRDAAAVAAALAEVFGLEVPPLDEARTGLEELADRGLITMGGHNRAAP